MTCRAGNNVTQSQCRAIGGMEKWGIWRRTVLRVVKRTAGTDRKPWLLSICMWQLGVVALLARQLCPSVFDRVLCSSLLAFGVEFAEWNIVRCMIMLSMPCATLLCALRLLYPVVAVLVLSLFFSVY
jgi:hypothetical protein